MPIDEHERRTTGRERYRVGLLELKVTGDESYKLSTIPSMTDDWCVDLLWYEGEENLQRTVIKSFCFGFTYNTVVRI